MTQQSRLLSREERERFAQWLEAEAESGKLILVQIEKLGPQFAAVVEREKMEVAAALVIARKLRSIEDQSIG